MTPRVLHLLPHRGGGAETYIDFLEGGRYEHERAAFSTSRAWYLAPPSLAVRVPMNARLARQFDLVHAHGDVASMLALPALRRRRSLRGVEGLAIPALSLVTPTPLKRAVRRALNQAP